MIIVSDKHNYPKLRRGTVGNRGRLLQAADDLLRTDPASASMPAIAEGAGLSIATAYRHFPTLGDVHTACMAEVLRGLLEASRTSTLKGTPLFEDTVDRWIAIIEVYGPAIMQYRPKTGILSRIQSDDVLACVTRDTWERPIREVLQELEVADDCFDVAFLLHVGHFDPAQIADLFAAGSGCSKEEKTRNLISAYYGAVRAWDDAAR